MPEPVRPEPYNGPTGADTAVELRRVQRALQRPVREAYGATVPTAGTWSVGDRVWNTTPSESGAGGSKYIVMGWVCTVAGSPGTWLQMRALTGN